MDRYAVIGHPVAHSLSPRIHAAFATSVGATLDYEAIDIPPEALAARLKALHAAGYQGLNVTVPHKHTIAALVIHLSERARLAGAANTLVRTESGWNADNTDGLGLIADLQDNLGLELAGKRIAVIGSGGAARGVIAPLMDTRPAKLVVSNRTPETPILLAGEFAAIGALIPHEHTQLAGHHFDLVINATSAGLQGEVPHLPVGIFAPGATAYDLNYGPASDPFMEWSARQGAARVCDGLGMLVEQAAESFRLWRGERPATAPVLARLRRQ